MLLIIISPDLIPGSLAAVAHVNAVWQHGERGGVESEFAVFDIGWLGP